ncbi:MAG: hypothetical protein K9K32_07530 [Halanaerobiales bacterium]|nr:hypothetical protein [Halanaerobiales bacterium]
MATKSHGRGILAKEATEESQKQYCEALNKWSLENTVVVFFFEAFDELWKGSENQDEPEKHWGFYTKDRTPKKIMN